jgi:hypothetical protein
LEDHYVEDARSAFTIKTRGWVSLVTSGLSNDKDPDGPSELIGLSRDSGRGSPLAPVDSEIQLMNARPYGQ